MSTQIVFEQILIIFGYMAVGFAAGKLHIIDTAQQKFLSRLITTLILPFTVIAASNLETQSSDLLNMFLAALLMLACFAATSAGCLAYARVRRLGDARRAAYTGLCTYPNSTFVGMPLCIALMGEWGTLYGAASIVAFNLLFFTLQVSLFTGKRFSLRSLITPLNISTLVLALMLALQLRLPAPVQTVFSNIGAINTPLALIVVGVMLANSSLREVFGGKQGYVITAVRNFLVPLLMIAVLAVLPFDRTMRLAVLIFVACPVGNLTSVYAIQTDKEPALCARATLLSTLLFAFSLPVILGIGQSVI